jgi:hypothetical protein
LVTRESSGKLKKLFSEKYFRQTIVITIVKCKKAMFLADISYSALIEFMPILLIRVGAGVRTPVEVYSIILAQIFSGIPGSLVSSYMVVKGFRKKMIIFTGFILCGLAVFWFLVASQFWMVVLATCLVNLFNQMGYSSLLAIITESYDVDIRAFGVGWANAWCKFGGVVSPITIGVIFETQGNIILGVFILSLGFCVVGIFSVLFKEPGK